MTRTFSMCGSTRAVKLDGHLHHMTRKSRWSRSMSALQKIASETNQAQVGRKVRVLVEQKGLERTQWDAPEIDGSGMVDENPPSVPGLTVRI